ncbi:MAG: histidine kinase, partial [Bacteroidota bacterium]
NPHFLFNTINSIFVLIHKNPDMASESLAKFSNLLRYQLYECNDNFIPLEMEVQFLQNFFELESLRQEENQQVNLQLDLPASGDLVIAPFLLIPFLENAFKHVSQEAQQVNQIWVRMRLTGQELLMEVGNTISQTPTSGQDLRIGGIGLQNVQRRLELLYPKRHTLSIEEGDRKYVVRLRLSLTPARSVAQVTLPVTPPNATHHPTLSTYP